MKRPESRAPALVLVGATGVYGSTDIVLNMQHDRMIRYLCAQFTAEAEQRIVRAVRADSMAMDW